ncbi:MAG: MgtC/SapB family protein [Porphyromonadaceae bacterium]|nr:MgtC/SapB family protein [Porphyromonadaceae bacterium]
MDSIEFILRLLAAMAAGGLIGLEREWSNKSAGLKTNMLVAVGACIYVLISVNISQGSEQSDPSRIIGQIVTGIGFLGGGVILHKGLNIQGLTTAATIWCSAAVGSVAGLGYFLEAAFCTIAVLIINLFFQKIEVWIETNKLKSNAKDSNKKLD